MIIKALDGLELELQTGDELLCSGTGRLSKVIIFYNRLCGVGGEAAELSHVAKYIQGYLHDGSVFEATTLNKWCNKKGYQHNLFSEWLSNYAGRVWVRQVQGCDITDAEYCTRALGLLGTPYENGVPGILELVFVDWALKWRVLKNWARKHLATKEIHCSEANVHLSQMAGYYDLSIRPNKMPPHEFWPGGRYEKGFIRGHLNEPIRLK